VFASLITELIYRTPSPDEKALVEAAQKNGFTLLQRTTDHLTVEEFGVLTPRHIITARSSCALNPSHDPFTS
jgi:magnesium-transporting ATPase (P-type)